MNDGPQNPGQPDPEEMAEQLRRMMQQLGLPVSGDLTSFMTQLSQMFGSGSSVGLACPGQTRVMDQSTGLTSKTWLGTSPLPMALTRRQVSRNAQFYSMRPVLQRAGSTANASSLR